MIEHIKFLFFLLLLFAGFWVISYLRQICKSNPDRILKALIEYSIWFLVVEAIRVLIIYLGANVRYVEMNPYFTCLSFLLYFGLIFSLYLMFNVMLSFGQKQFSKRQNRWLTVVAGFVFIAFVTKTFVPESYALLAWTNYIHIAFFSIVRVVVYLELILLVASYFFWGKSKLKPERKKLSKSFILLFVFANNLPVILFMLSSFSNANHPLGWIFILLVNFTFFAISFLWTKCIFLEYAQKMSSLVNKDDQFKSICAEFNISKREVEIIELLIDGKSTNEIKEDLFISYHTVKNHISHIYGKLDVKTRPELIHFFVKMK